MELMSGTTACHPQLKVSSKVKTYVLDTNVLLHDPQSIFKFEENNLAIPVEVLEELDAIKSEQSTERGRNARRVHRLLQGLLPDSHAMRPRMPTMAAFAQRSLSLYGLSSRMAWNNRSCSRW